MKLFLEQLFAEAVDLNHENIRGLLEQDEEASFLDLGCDDCVVTALMGRHIGTRKLFGVEVMEEKAEQASSKGVTLKNFDLNKTFDFADEHFDVILSNQVIEHLHNSDNFVGEIHRVLKKGGYAIISTENASSWCNIFASLIGWQIFSLTNFSSLHHGIGNPLALHRGDKSLPGSWNHVRIYNIRGLKEYFEAFGFIVEKIRGSGYFPLPAFLGDIDKTHCHFMTFKIRKK